VIAPSNPRQLRATYARRLDSNDVIVVNGFLGRTRGVKATTGTFSGDEAFAGEVIGLDGTFDPARRRHAGFSFGKTNWASARRACSTQPPRVEGVRPLFIPVFADRR
jgi:hypothetical protein